MDVDCCWLNPGDRQYCPGEGCTCECHNRPEPATPEVERLRQLLLEASSEAHVAGRHPPYGSSFLDCSWSTCTARREAISAHGKVPLS